MLLFSLAPLPPPPSLPPLRRSEARVLSVFLPIWIVWWLHCVEHDLFSDPFTPSASSVAFKPGLFHVPFSPPPPLFCFFLFCLELKETLVVLCYQAAMGVKSCWLPYSFSRGLVFVALTHREVFTHRFLDQFLDTSSTKKSCTHSFGSHPFILALFFFFFPFWSLYFLSLAPLSATPPFSVIFIMPLLNPPVVVLVRVQVSHPTDPWGRCRCKWISSLTLAPESTKSAWRVRFSSLLRPAFCRFLFKMCSHLQMFKDSPRTAHGANLICLMVL